MKAAFSLFAVLMASAAIHSASYATPRTLPDGGGPRLGRITAELPAFDSVLETSELQRAPTEFFVDLPCNVFLPGKADPQEWMATSTLVYYTLDGIQYQYGYDPFAQSYDMMVSGLAHSSGILLQETVGIMVAELSDELEIGQVERVEAWFLVSSHNLFPNEFVGITAIEGPVWPSSSLDAIDIQRVYADARGFTGLAYAIEHFGVGPHAIDLGASAVTELESRIDDEGWFGVGFGADGWDLSGSAGTAVQWTVFGGGNLPAGNRPFFRVYYNAPPAPFALQSPAHEATTAETTPSLSWSAAIDPNGDAPLEYTLRFGTDPTLTAAVELTTQQTSTLLPFPLGEATYYWEVVASDPKGATRTSERRSFTVAFSTAAPVGPRGFALSAFPNPFNPRTELHFVLNQAMEGVIEVIDLRGRRVRILKEGRLEAGAHRVRWNGEDAQGRPCASGVYVARLHTTSRQEQVRLTLVR